MKVAVYGSLLKGLHNHNSYLGEAKYIGEFQTEPKFTMVDLGSFPGLLNDGNTSVSMEVYDVDDVQLSELDRLEGYSSDTPEQSYYKRELFKTPYGEAYYYVFNGAKRKDENIVTGGNWREYKLINKLTV